MFPLATFASRLKCLIIDTRKGSTMNIIVIIMLGFFVWIIWYIFSHLWNCFHRWQCTISWLLSSLFAMWINCIHLPQTTCCCLSSANMISVCYSRSSNQKRKGLINMRFDVLMLDKEANYHLMQNKNCSI